MEQNKNRYKNNMSARRRDNSVAKQLNGGIK